MYWAPHEDKNDDEEEEAVVANGDFIEIMHCNQYKASKPETCYFAFALHTSSYYIQCHFS